MPIVNAYFTSGYTAEQKKAFLNECAASIQVSLQAPTSSIRIVLHESSADNNWIAGHADNKLALLVVYLIEGRTTEQKRSLIAALNAACVQTLNVGIEDARIVINDIPKDSMGVAGGISALDAGR